MKFHLLIILLCVTFSFATLLDTSHVRKRRWLIWRGVGSSFMQVCCTLLNNKPNSHSNVKDSITKYSNLFSIILLLFQRIVYTPLVSYQEFKPKCCFIFILINNNFP